MFRKAHLFCRFSTGFDFLRNACSSGIPLRNPLNLIHHRFFKISPKETLKFTSLVAPYCAIPRDYLSDTPPIARYGVFGVSTWPIGCDTLSPFLSVSHLESMRSGGAIPPLQKGISAILERYPIRRGQMGAIPPSAILSRKGIARYGGVSRTGPLSLPVVLSWLWFSPAMQT